MCKRVSSGRSLLNVYGLEIWSGLSVARRRHMARADKIIADCNFTADYVRETSLHAKRPSVIWDCVDLNRFAPAPSSQAVRQQYGIPSPATHFIVMSLGRLVKTAVHKGFDRLIEVVAGLASSFPALRLVIAGRGDDRARLEALAVQLGIADRVVFTGAVHEDHLADVYRAAHVFSLVSDRGCGRGEGIPLTPLEAMGCGVPIIVGDEDGSREAIVDGQNGFIVSPRDPNAHADALRRLIESQQLRVRLAKGAVQVVREHFSYRRFVQQHRELFETSGITEERYETGTVP